MARLVIAPKAATVSKRINPISPFYMGIYERKGDKLLPFPQFVGRVGTSFLVAFSIVTVALLGGTLGYHFIARLRWIDAVLNAAMILTGMGPVDPMKDVGSKLFAAFYALFSGVVFLTSIGIVLSPVFHRVVHKFHLAEDTVPEKPKRPDPSKQK